MKFQLNTIEEAISEIQQGRVVIVVDDEGRENEGDFLTAARNATPEVINFMATHGRGLICAPISEERCDALGLEMMVNHNSAAYETPFTVSIDLIGHGCTTGISASDRSKTILALIDPNIRPEELGKPGHIFPLRARKGGVLRRAGHTEAAVDLSRLAGFEEAGVIVEILNEDGTMARVPSLIEIAKRFDLKIVSIEDLIKYRVEHESLIEEQVSVHMPTEFGDFQLKAFKDTSNDQDHLVLTKGTWEKDEPVLVRVHSSCLTGDIFGSCRCDCGPQLHKAMEVIEKEEGLDTYEANEKLGFKADERDYGIGAQIIRSIGISKMRLMSNNPKKRTGLIGYGLEIVENVGLEIESNVHNQHYLETKRDKMGHNLKLD